MLRVARLRLSSAIANLHVCDDDDDDDDDDDQTKLSVASRSNNEVYLQSKQDDLKDMRFFYKATAFFLTNCNFFRS